MGLPFGSSCLDQRLGAQVRLGVPGVGWVLWRDSSYLPEELVFDVNYLGGHMPTFSLNFSRPGSEVVAQYFMFAALGFEGYRRVQQHSSQVARYLALEIADLGPYRLVTDASDLPVFAFSLDPSVKNYDVFDVSERLRERGWLVPAYTYPANRQDLAVLRMVIRAGMSFDMADKLLEDLSYWTAKLERLSGPLPQETRSATRAFAH